jgi:hypothetical protein
MTAAVRARRRRWGRSYRRRLGAWHEATLAELRSEDFIREFRAAWSDRFTDGSEVVRTGSLLRLELTGVTDMLLDMVDAPEVSPPTRERQRKGWKIGRLFRRTVGLSEAIKAGGTLAGSLKDLLESGPWWVKSLLIILEELGEVASDGLSPEIGA